MTTLASAGINSLASSLDFSDPRNKVVVSNLEFPTGAQIWHAQTSRGAVVEHAPEAADGTVPLEQFDRLIDERTKLVPDHPRLLPQRREDRRARRGWSGA